MDIKKYMAIDGEQPLDNMVVNGGFCGILRTIACIGDSLSSGELESLMDGKVGWHDYYDLSWGQFIARDAGCTVYNFSKGGMTAKNYCTGFAAERGFYSPELAARAYIIALGVNDISRCMEGVLEFGTLDDVNKDEPEKNGDSLIGYYARIISDYKRIQPKAKFFLVTPPRCTWVGEARAKLYEKLSETLRAFAQIFDNCYVIDLRRYGPVYDDEFKHYFYMGGHLNAAGYRLTALMMESYIDYIIRHNPKDFTQIGFVGTEFYNENEKW